jgi:hypothetical protein
MYNPNHTLARRPHTLLASLVIAALAALPLTSNAWTEFFPTSKIQVEDSDGTYHNYDGTTTSINFGDVRYSNSGGTESFQVVGLSQKRVERRYNDDYSSTVNRRWLANVLFNSPTSGVTIHQLFNGTTGPHVLVTGQSASSGSVKVYNLTSSSTTVATGVYGVTFKLESKNWNTGSIQILINGSLVLTGSRRSGSYYTKYGMYNPNAAQTIKFSSVHIYQ